MNITKEMISELSIYDFTYMLFAASTYYKHGKTFEYILKNRDVFSLEDFLNEVEYYSIVAPTPEISDTLEKEAFNLCKMVLNYRKFRRMI